MQNAAQPTSPSRRRRRGRKVLSEHGPSHTNDQNEQNKAALHGPLNSSKTFLGCKIAVKPFMNSRMLSQSIGMRTLCLLVFCLAFALADGTSNLRQCPFRAHAQADGQDPAVLP